MIEVRPVQTKHEKNIFITFPWRIYKGDPLWIPPIISEREKAMDPARGLFFKGGGIADLYIAWKDGKPVGTIVCSREKADAKENMFGFFECIDDYAVAEALFKQAETWARDHHLATMIGTYNLDREENRGILIEGRDRPAPLLCGYNPPYYPGFFERYGFGLEHDDGLAYALDLDLNNPNLQHLARVAEQVRQRKTFKVRGAHMDDVENEIDRIWELQNRALEHLPGFMPYPREAIETMVLPLKEMADADLVLFAEVNGKAIGWFPAIPNFNEILIHINGLRYPWNYIPALYYQHKKIESIAIKSVAVPPEYWDTGVAVLLFDEMVKRAVAKGYKWADLSMTGEDNPDTWDLAHHMGAKIYKRYRFYKKEV